MARAVEQSLLTSDTLDLELRDGLGRLDRSVSLGEQVLNQLLQERTGELDEVGSKEPADDREQVLEIPRERQQRALGLRPVRAVESTTDSVVEDAEHFPGQQVVGLDVVGKLAVRGGQHVIGEIFDHGRRQLGRDLHRKELLQHLIITSRVGTAAAPRGAAVAAGRKGKETEEG